MASRVVRFALRLHGAPHLIIQDLTLKWIDPEMDQLDLERLAKFSDDVRDSTLKRLKLVPGGRENDCFPDGTMSPADIAAHLIQCDEKLFELPRTRFSAKTLGVAGQRVVRDAHEYARLVASLERLRETRREFILAQDDASLAEPIAFERLIGKGEMDLGSILYRTLDHEIHHRGALAVFLRHMEGASNKPFERTGDNAGRST